MVYALLGNEASGTTKDSVVVRRVAAELSRDHGKNLRSSSGVRSVSDGEITTALLHLGWQS